MKKLKLKLAVGGRILAAKKESCALDGSKSGKLPPDPLIPKRK